ncbi:hypothetical protein BDZ97DRAFT_1818835 [Flammula alnicola]|nr:hypothetical protein BDZ97DRAFT_1818835 [Flammula alnicola]
MPAVIVKFPPKLVFISFGLYAYCHSSPPKEYRHLARCTQSSSPALAALIVIDQLIISSQLPSSTYLASLSYPIPKHGM